MTGVNQPPQQCKRVHVSFLPANHGRKVWSGIIFQTQTTTNLTTNQKPTQIKAKGNHFIPMDIILSCLLTWYPTQGFSPKSMVSVAFWVQPPPIPIGLGNPWGVEYCNCCEKWHPYGVCVLVFVLNHWFAEDWTWKSEGWLEIPRTRELWPVAKCALNLLKTNHPNLSKLYSKHKIKNILTNF